MHRMHRAAARALPAALLWSALSAPPAWTQKLQDTQLELPGVWAGKAAWGDYDGDGDPDLLLVGETESGGQCLRIARVLRNDAGLLAEDVAQSQRLVGVYFGDAGWADYDGDGDLDAAVAGWDANDLGSLRLYTNDAGPDDGERLLTPDMTQVDDAGNPNFRGVRYADLSWTDFDRDGDLDLTVTGLEGNGTSLTHLYRNRDGLLTLDEANSEALVNVHNGDLAWADYDNDGDLDLALSGENVISDNVTRITEFYRNDPVGDLELDVSVAAAPRVKGGSLAWADYDNDGNLDLALSGRGDSWAMKLLLYRNRPAGTLGPDDGFSLNPFQTIDGQLAWVDYDNDGDQDLAVSGRTLLSDHRAQVFDNDGGTVTSGAVENLEGLAGGAAVWGDYDGDGRVDLLLSGVDQSGERRTVLYGNRGVATPNRTPSAPATLNPVQVTSTRALFSWPAGEDVESQALSYNLRIGTRPGGDDVLSASLPPGPGNAGLRTSYVLERSLPPNRYYWSVQAVDGGFARSPFSTEGSFVVEDLVSSDQSLRNLEEASMSWGDIDDDGDADLAIMGRNRSGEARTLVYVNEAGELRPNLEAGVTPLRNGDLAWGDYDNDGDLDLVVTGQDGFGTPHSELFATDVLGGKVSFERAGAFPDLSLSSVDWGDADRDGDLDLVLMGLGSDIDGATRSHTQLWLNDGEGGFAEAQKDLVGLHDGEAAWADADGDGDSDLAVTGTSSAGTPELRLYLNDGSGPGMVMLSLTGLESSDLAWGDWDRDGDPDLLTAGTGDGGMAATLWENDGGSFTEAAGAGLPGIRDGDLAWGDYDNDQDLDVVIAGNDGSQAILQIWENTIGRTGAGGPFEQVALEALRGVQLSAAAFADIEEDGDLDLVSAGRGATGSPLSAINENLTARFNPNFPPRNPSGLEADDDSGGVVLSWQASGDDGAPPPESLTYNLRVGTTSRGNEVISGLGEVGPGNNGHLTERTLVRLESGTYFWSVQAVDAGFARSGWSPERRFVMDAMPPVLGAHSTSRQLVGLDQTITLALEFTDEHSGIDASTAPTVQAAVGSVTLDFEQVQFTGGTWSGELTIAAGVPSGTATISVRGVLDGKGNELIPVDLADAFEVDAVAPEAVAFEPASGAGEVPVSTSVLMVRFSEPIDEATVDERSFSLRSGESATTPLAATYDPETQVAVLTPEGGLLPGTPYTVEVSASVRDLAGNRLADTMSWSFSTAVPQLLETSPADGAEGVDPATERIVAVFDGPLTAGALDAPGAVQVLREGEPFDFAEAPMFDADSNSLSFALARGLEPGTRYEIILDGSLAGPLRLLGQGDFRWSFATAVPQLLETSPADGAEGVDPATERIVAVFDGPLAASALDAPGTVQVLRGEDPLDLAETPLFDAEGNSLSFAVAGGLVPASRYEVILDGSLAGPLRLLGQGDFRWSFTTAAPQLLETRPTDGETGVGVDLAEATVTFSVSLDPDQITRDNFRLLREGEPVALRSGDPAERDPGTYALAPEAGWQVGSSYSVEIAADVTGQLSVSGPISWNFQTAVPVATGLNPAADDDAVAAATREITAVFDNPIDEAALIAEGGARLLLEGSPEALEEPSWDPGSRTVTLTPATGLRAGSAYTVILSAAIAGPRAGAETRWSFGTVVPSVASTDPADGASIAAGRRRVEVQFTAPIDAGLVMNSNNFRLSRSGQPLQLDDGDFLYDEAANKVSLPEVDFLSGSSYEAAVLPRVRGPRGADAGPFTWGFTTDLPAVVATSPQADAEGVSITTEEIRIEFSLPVAVRDGRGFTLLARPLEEGPEGEEAGFEVTAITGFAIDSGFKVVSFAPRGGLRPFTEYRVSVGPEVFGELADRGFEFAFRTAPRLTETASGGLLATGDRRLELYLPPNALAGGSGEIAIRRLADAGAEDARSRDLTPVGPAFEIDAGDGVLRKPGTLTLRYEAGDVEGLDTSRLAIFRLVDGEWTRVGGTSIPAEREVRTSVEDFGTYGIFEDLTATAGAAAIDGIDCQPRAFAPAGGSGALRDKTDISFDLAAAADVTVRVYNASGRLERVIARDRPMAPGRQSLTWNGRDEEGKVVASGLYVVVVSGGDMQSEKIVAVVR